MRYRKLDYMDLWPYLEGPFLCFYEGSELEDWRVEEAEVDTSLGNDMSPHLSQVLGAFLIHT